MGGGKGLGFFSGTAGSNQRERLLLSVSNQKLKTAIEQIYRPNATIGDGGLADAILYEKHTGKKIRNCSHLQKGKERLINLENILANENLNEQDTKIISKLIADIQTALKED